MNDLEERLHGIDRLTPPPDLMARAQAQASQPTYQRPQQRRDRTHRYATIAVALAIGLAGVLALVLAFSRRADSSQISPASSLRGSIVYATVPWPDDPGQIYTMHADGSHASRLTTDGASYSSVTVSPDASRLAYVRDVSGSNESPGSEGIYVANADGSDATQIYEFHGTPVGILELEWSPDGERLAFVQVSMHSGPVSDWSYKLWMVGVDGSDPHAVSDARITSFSWGPSGDELAVTVELANGDQTGSEIYVMGDDGRGLSPVTPWADLGHPVWSPDGRWIAFAQSWGQDKRGVVAIVRPDGSALHAVPNRKNGTYPLAWSPDSASILVDGGLHGECSTQVTYLDGQSVELMHGTTVLGVDPRDLQAGETPQATGDPCVQSASWVG